jgi:hypothetical protein
MALGGFHAHTGTYEAFVTASAQSMQIQAMIDGRKGETMGTSQQVAPDNSAEGRSREPPGHGEALSEQGHYR